MGIYIQDLMYIQTSDFFFRQQVTVQSIEKARGLYIHEVLNIDPHFFDFSIDNLTS